MIDKQGRVYARMHELQPGNTVIVDDGFTCMKPWGEHSVSNTGNGLYILCERGPHYLSGQLADDRDSLVGIYHKTGFKKDPSS